MNTMDFNDAFRLTIDGRAVEADGGATFAVVNPADAQVIAAAPDCTAEQLDRAVAAARRAFPLWRARSEDERGAMLRAAAQRMLDNVEPLGLLLTREQGKPLKDACAEIANAARWFTTFAQARLPVETKREADGRIADIRRVPIGVVGAISPWNFPVQLAIWKVAPALMAGNCVVLKPSPFTPLSTLKLGELLLDIFPAGVFNTISGGDHLGPLMSGHPDIDKIAFTGSTATGKAVMRGAAGNLKRLTLELGGNDAAIVLPDADIDQVVERVFWGAFGNAGQICVAAKRIYVHDAIYDRFAARMAELARANQPRGGETPGVTMGPVQNEAQFRRVKGIIEQARADGLRFLTEPGDMAGPGYFISPTIIDNPPDDAQVVREEPFGPVVPLLRYTDIDDTIRRANDSEYGLAASIWGTDVEAAAQVGRALEVGTVWLNTIHGLSPIFPFAGHKQSGVGVENSEEGFLEYTNVQAMIRPGG